MRLWIFSDLHLTEADSPLYRSLIRVISEAQNAQDHLVFAGDIFDLMVGSSSFYQKKYAQFFLALNEAILRGARIHYIEGNHDFHLRKLFPNQVQFEDEAIVLTDLSQGKPKKIYIAHGDLVDQGDHAYLKLRNHLRSKPVQLLSRILPGEIIEKIGMTFSRSLDEKARDGARSGVRETFRRFAEEKHQSGFDRIVLGHCHDFDSVPPYYFNMGYPPVQNQYLYYDTLSDLSRRPFPHQD